MYVADQGPIPLSPGIHSFPFKLGLPLGLPSTFLGKHGWVQYFCRAALREAGGLTHKNQQVFIVMNPIDLNLEPSILAVKFLNFIMCTVYNRKWISSIVIDGELVRGSYLLGVTEAPVSQFFSLVKKYTFRQGVLFSDDIYRINVILLFLII